MKKIIILLILLFIVILLSGCATYYTKLYVINDPPKDMIDWRGYDVVAQFEGMDISISFIGPYNERDIIIAGSDSFALDICIQRSKLALHASDSIIIDSTSVTLPHSKLEIAMKEKEGADEKGIYCGYFHNIYIPASEELINVRFVLRIQDHNGAERSSIFSETLHRYERKNWGQKIFH
jgi:hypothetical protein